MANNKRIVLATFGSLGDLHPTIALALELRKRGHHAVIATTEAYRSKVEGIGLGFHSLRPELDFNDPGLMQQMLDSKTGTEVIVREILLPALRHTYEDLMEAVQGSDLLVSINNGILVAPLIAQKTRMRWVSCVLDPYYIYSDVLAVTPFSLVNNVVIKLVKFSTTFMPLLRLLHKRISELGSELGLPRVKLHMIWDELFSPELVLALYSPLLAAPLADYPRNTQIKGFVFYDRLVPNQGLSPEIIKFLDSGSPPIVFTLGSWVVYNTGAVNFYTESVVAAQKLGYRAILLVGNVLQNLPQKLLPEGMITVDYTPYSELFPRAAAVVHQGGMGTTAQALLAGTPMLVVPYCNEQPDNAARIVRLGVGRTLNPQQYHRDRVAIELNKLLTQPQYKMKTLEVRNRIQFEKGVQDACDAIEKHLSLNKETQTV